MGGSTPPTHPDPHCPGFSPSPKHPHLRGRCSRSDAPSMPVPSCVEAGTAGDGVQVFVVGVSHDTDASVRDVQQVLRKLRPAAVCLELPSRSVEGDGMLAEYRRFVAGEGGFSLRRWAALYRHGFRSAALDRWLGARTDHFTEYRDGCRARSGFAQHPGGREMQAAAQEAAELGATVEWIDAPAEISSARAWNQKDIVSNMWRTAVRWHRTVPKATCPDTWKDTPPQGWDDFRASSEALIASYDVRQAADRQRLALDVGGGSGGTAKGRAAQVFEGADLRVWLYERDLILADNLHRVATQLAGPGGRRQRRKGAVGAKHDRAVVGVLGLARTQQRRCRCCAAQQPHQSQ